MPVLYVHGWKDDGAHWGLRSESCEPGSAKPKQASGAGFFSEAGIQNWAVQWWAPGGDPYATHEEGFAFLSTGDELIQGAMWLETGSYSAQNYPCPSPANLKVAPDLSGPVKENFRAENTYNDSGRVEDHARDLLDMLRAERAAGRLQDWSQVNILTHSKGSLVTRAMLHMAAEESRHDVEFVSNVIYNAPPFAGSPLAPFVSDFFSAQPADAFTNPWLAGVVDSLIQHDVDTVGAILQHLLEVMVSLRNGAISTLRPLEELLPPGTLAPLEALKLPAFKVRSSGEFFELLEAPPARIAVSLLGGIVRSAIQTFSYFPAEPALSDLSPELLHPLAYQTRPEVKQYITYGTLFLGTAPFVCDLSGGVVGCAGEIAADPSILADPSRLSSTRGDLVVSSGSARLLADTDAFGPPMEILAEYDGWHGDLGSNIELMGGRWMQVLLAPLTSLELEGQIQEVSADERSYVVSADTELSFAAEEVTARTAPWYRDGLPHFAYHTARASEFQYRLVPVYQGSGAPTPWAELPKGAKVRFSELMDAIADAAGSPESPFFLQWRSVNEHGGREMIRQARFVVEPELAQVVSTRILGHPEEIAAPPPGIMQADRALRPSVLTGISPSLIEALRASAEPSWAIRAPDGKALVVVLSHRGNLAYAWDDETFANPTRLENVGGTLIPLEGLSEGLHVLRFETYNAFGTSPRHLLRILVDDTPPVITFQYQSDHGLGIVVGPQTPLRIEAHDVGTGTGQGELSIEGHGPYLFSANSTFFLGQTSIAQIGRGAGLEGLLLKLVATARDRVSNEASEEIEVYYDWSPPTISVVEVSGALPSGGGYRSFQPEVEIVVEAQDTASGVSPPTATAVGPDQGVLPSPPFAREAAANRWKGSVRLAPGRNRVVISAADAVGNVGEVEIVVEYSQVEFGGEPVETLSYRLDIECLGPTGSPTACIDGSISDLSSALHGDAVAFSSAGNRFIQGDTNGVDDVFLWRNGSILRVSEGPNGEQADRASTSPALSGDGRYVFFRSLATNLVPGTQNQNLYVKDTRTGALALVSRRSDGSPANVSGVDSFRSVSATYDGRYVIFDARGSEWVAGLSDTNNERDVFLVDLDPDEDGDLFNSDYVTHGISVVGNRTGNGASRSPQITQDGRYAVFLTQATDLHQLLATQTQPANQAVLVELGMTANAFGQLSFFPISTSNATGGGMLAQGVSAVRIAPFSDTVVFASRSNVAGTGDTNNEATGQDLYVSERDDPAGPAHLRTIRWVSQANGPGGPQTGTSDAPFASISIAAEPTRGPSDVKVAWVSGQTNIEPNDTNGVDDMFLRRVSPTWPQSLPVINWVAGELASTERVVFGDLSPDGRYAFWSTQQRYEAPFGATETSLYRRRIEPSFEAALEVEISGGGSVERFPAGRAEGGAFLYFDDERVNLRPQPDKGYRFAGWEGVDLDGPAGAVVSMYRDRQVRARFAPMSPPTLLEPLSITTLEDTPSAGVRPAISDPDPDDDHTLSILRQPSYGRARVVDGLIVYTPSPDFHGTDSFTFQIHDSAGLTLASPGEAQVVVEPVNDPPSSASVVLRVGPSGRSAATAPTVLDVDGETSFELAISVEPQHGSVQIQSGAFLYTAGASFAEEDDFLFTASDAAGASVIGIGTVIAVSDDPGEEPGEGGSGGPGGSGGQGGEGAGGVGGAGGTGAGGAGGGPGPEPAPVAGGESGCGCGAGSSSPAAFWPLLAAAWLWRARTRSRR